MRFVVASPGLERATALNVGQELHLQPPGRNTLTDFVIPWGAEGGYSSYFKLFIAEIENVKKLIVADGATYSSPESLGDAMICKVNANTLEVPAVMLDLPSVTKYVYLQYTAPQTDSEGNETSASVTIVTGEKMPVDTESNVYFLIGRVIVNAGSVSISQDWTGGVPQILWFQYCGA